MKNSAPSTAAFKAGAVALAFLVLGYQIALFVGHSARMRIEAHRDRPDTVYVWGSVPELPEALASFSDLADGQVPGADRPTDAGTATLKKNRAGDILDASGVMAGKTVRRNADHSRFVEALRRETRRVESFPFNPNTVSVEDLVRLGFSEKQARAIDNYRSRGGHFRRREDFARSFVVADSVYRRLERFIDIPRIDLNRADSAALDALPGIGPWFAEQILRHRDELGGYSYPEQLLDIYRFDQEKFDALSDLVCCSVPTPYRLWTLPADSLRLHPYIRSRQTARAIVLFRDHTPRSGWNVDALAAAGILPDEDAARLARCVLEIP